MARLAAPPAARRPAARRAGGRPRRGACARCTSACAASARACSTAPGRGGTCASTTPSPSATAPSRCRPSLVPDGYALYAVRADRDDDGPAGEVDDPRARRRHAGGARAAVGLPARPGPDADDHLGAGAARRAAVADAHRSRRRPRRPRERAVGAPRRRRRRAGRPRLRERPRRRARGRRRLLPLERRALPAGRRRLRAHRRRARPRARRRPRWAPPTSAGRRCASWRAPAASPSCARARWRARRRPSAAMSRRGARRSSEGRGSSARRLRRCAAPNSIIEGRSALGGAWPGRLRAYCASSDGARSRTNDHSSQQLAPEDDRPRSRRRHSAFPSVMQ